MPEQHKDRLTAIDASFLAQEHRASHMHVGALVIVEGPPPEPEDFLESIRSRLHLVPRYRQKLKSPRLEMGRPFWIDDPRFNLEYHVRFTALPAPGTEEQLRQLAGRVFSQRLDRSKPLWELWAVQGLDDGRFALITKTHHAMIDGIAGVDIATVLFDLSPAPPEIPPSTSPWTPNPEPSQAELVAEGVKDAAKAPVDLASQAVGALRHPRRTASRAMESVEAIGEVAWAGLNPAPATPLNTEIGPHRRVHWVSARLDDFKAIKDDLGGTVNDVVVAVVSGALRRWLRGRGVRTEGLELRALVPVSIRTEEEHGQLGNRIAAMRGPLPVYVEDPVERLRIVSAAMRGLKESKQALGAEVLAGLQGFAPPTLLAQASRLNFSTRLFNLIVTNVPGPQFPLYMLGRELQEIVPLAFLPDDHALAVAVMSYNGGIDFGLLGDYDAMPDIEEFGEFIERSLDELLDATAPPRRQRRPAKRKARASA
ncbi:MAG TPA: wax ester/triacylglycerol synthase family O-acyltransferase [Thermoleophilaceae bacterium]|nr:wax ester/triacylglycerol synthase family O-acyltransferase [Thermoleophilaceae bacterium]